MFSAKSAKLIIMIHNFRERGHRPLVVTSSLDDRFGDVGEIHSRIPGLQCEAFPVINGETSETDLLELCKKEKPTVMFADEVQFYSKNQIRQLCDIVDDYGINVFAFGLRASFKGELFPATEVLMALADTIREVKTVCECGSKATINVLIDKEGRAVSEGESIQIGDSSYLALCRKCWKKKLVK